MKKEDFEQRGWIFMNENDLSMNFKRNDIWKYGGGEAFLYCNGNSIKIKMTEGGYNIMSGPTYIIKFDGFCKNFDEFDLIYKMIKPKI